MVWALGASLVANGLLAGFILGREWGWWEKEEPYVVREAYGGGIPQDPDTDYEWDRTVVGFRGQSGK